MDLRTISPARSHDLHVSAAAPVGHQVRLSLTGVLDGPNTELLTAAFTAALDDAAGDVELEVAGLTFLDSSGIRALLQCRKAAHRRGRRLRLVDPGPLALDVLAVTGLLGVFGLEA